MRRLLNAWLYQDRDPVNLLWLDAWQVSRQRPALMAEVGRQMNADLGPRHPPPADYAPFRSMVIVTNERLLALPPGTLSPVMES
jgi:hypothetical protein